VPDAGDGQAGPAARLVAVDLGLRTGGADAVLIGLWGCLEIGWLDGLPPALDPRRR
jgi:hypothetical protein